MSELGFITFFLSQALSFSVCRSSEALVWLWCAIQLALLCGGEQDPCTFPMASSEFSLLGTSWWQGTHFTQLPDIKRNKPAALTKEMHPSLPGAEHHQNTRVLSAPHQAGVKAWVSAQLKPRRWCPRAAGRQLWVPSQFCQDGHQTAATSRSYRQPRAAQGWQVCSCCLFLQ